AADNDPVALMLDEPGTELGGAPFGAGPLIEQHVAHVTGQATDHGQPLTGRADGASGPTHVAHADRAVRGGHEGGLSVAHQGPPPGCCGLAGNAVPGAESGDHATGQAGQFGTTPISRRHWSWARRSSISATSAPRRSQTFLNAASHPTRRARPRYHSR